MGDEIDHVQTGDVLLIEQVDRLGVLLAEQGDQDIGPLTSFLPADCTWKTARCKTRWKPSVGWVSRWASAGNRGVVSSMKAPISRRSRSESSPQARSTRAAVGLSSSDSSRCSTVMYSWCLMRASLKAWFSENSSSLLSMVALTCREGWNGRRVTFWTKEL